MGIVLNSPCESIGKNPTENAYFLRVPNIWPEPGPGRLCTTIFQNGFWPLPLCLVNLILETSLPLFYHLHSLPLFPEKSLRLPLYLTFK